MDKPDDIEAQRCMEIRKRSKRGEYVSPEEHAFCEQMWKKYPTWYKKTQARVFNETVPFGSNVRIEEPED